MGVYTRLIHRQAKQHLCTQARLMAKAQATQAKQNTAQRSATLSPYHRRLERHGGPSLLSSFRKTRADCVFSCLRAALLSRRISASWLPAIPCSVNHLCASECMRVFSVSDAPKVPRGCVLVTLAWGNRERILRFREFQIFQRRDSWVKRSEN